MSLDPSDFIVALGLLFVLEGLALAAFPGAVERALLQLHAIPEEARRWGGLLFAVIGVFVLYMIGG